MTYDFTSIIDRRGMDALAVDDIGQAGGMPGPRAGFSAIPMWVADMNFATAPAVTQAIAQRLQHPAFGYFHPRQEYFDAIIRWQSSHNGVVGLKPEHIGYSNGVLGGIVSLLNVLCPKGDQILLHSPTYCGFTHALTQNGYRLTLSPLVKDDQDIWRMDFEDMERKIVENKIHTAIFCSPHNPTGRVWERWELEQAMELYKKHDVFVISDEIWSDLILPGHQHIPTQSVSEDARMRTAAMYSPSKGFNLAGLQGSYRIIYNKWLREQVDKESELCNYNHMNIMSMYGLIGAYSPEGEQWLMQLRQVLDGNIDYACRFIRDRLPGVSLSRPQGTYLLYLDCGDWCRTHGKTIDDVFKACTDVGVTVQDGRIFNGPTHLRVNIAMPLSMVQDAFQRLEQYVFNP